MPDLTLQSVSQDVDENNKDHKDENCEDQKEVENSSDNTEVENSSDNKEVENSTDRKDDENSEDKKEHDHNEAKKLVTSQGEEFCNICLVKLTSKGQADTHFEGSRHKKAVALLLEHIKKTTAKVVVEEDNKGEVADEDNKAEVADEDSKAEVADEDSKAEVVDDSNAEVAEVTPQIEDQDIAVNISIFQLLLMCWQVLCSVVCHCFLNDRLTYFAIRNQRDTIRCRISRSGVSYNDEVKKSKRIDFFCEICLVKLTSTTQIDVHYEGKKHKRAMEILKDHPRSLAELAANQDSLALEDDDHLNNVCVVKPTSRDPDDPPCRGSKRRKASGEKTDSLNGAAGKQVSSNGTSQSADKDSDESGEKQKDDTASQTTSKKSKKPKGEEIVCSVCMVKLTSKSQEEKHNEGSKHKRALAIVTGKTDPTNPIVGNQNKRSDIAVQNIRQANRNIGVQRLPSLMQPNASRITPLKDNECICSICVVKLTSTLQAVMHYEGRQHKKAAAVVAGNSEQKVCEGTKKKPVIICEVCHVTLSSQVVADAHYAGSKHTKKLQLFQSRNGGLAQEAIKPGMESVCDICIVPLSSKVVADVHYASSRHNRKLQILQSISGKSGEAPSDGDSQVTAPMKVISRASSQVTENSSISIMSTAGILSEEQRKALVGNFFSCDVCNIKVNSQQQMEAHWQGTKHKSHIIGQTPRLITKNRPPARSRIIAGGLNLFPGNLGAWGGLASTFRPRPTMQYNHRVL